MRTTRNALLAALNPASHPLLQAAEDAARDLGAGLWVVGGAVRDLAARRPIHDLDLAFAADPTQFVDALLGRLRVPVEVERTDRFGTASIRDPESGARLDLASLRSERYVVAGALPAVRPAPTIEADLPRRDFSVNAIALELVPNPDTVVDPFGGLEDIAAGRLRVLHERSFIDDPTRIWRGARTAALLNLEPEPVTANLIREGARWIAEVSGERLWNELAYTAARSGRGRALATMQRLEDWGTLRAIHPAFRLSRASAQALANREAMPVERLAAVLLAPVRDRAAVMERFHASADARSTVADTARILGARPTPAVLATLEGVCPEARIAARWLDPDGQRSLQAALTRWQRTRSPLTAQELVEAGVSRGPALGAALRGLRRARYLGTLNTPADARRFVRRVLAGEGSWDEGPDAHAH